MWTPKTTIITSKHLTIQCQFLHFFKALIIISTFLHTQLFGVVLSQSSDAQEYLDAHNNFRRKKGVPPVEFTEQEQKLNELRERTNRERERKKRRMFSVLINLTLLNYISWSYILECQQTKIHIPLLLTNS